ncbi:MAG: alanine dehydrogenase [Chlorobiaceae bacterium]|nr:alanine dehydrogenase [Chlorobiaceae bacterium]NTV27036.1 alanine dehydrogenase [Chlorobiaceae bacterium]
MNIGIPKEIKTRENRVACTPAGVRHLVSAGHRVVVERGAGDGSGFSDEKYRLAGAVIASGPEEPWRCELVVKVKEPVEREYGFLRSDQMLFTFLHLAGVPELARRLVEAGTTAIAYETVEVSGRLPLLAPMSEIAGKMSIIMGGYFLSRHQGGEGKLLGGVPGVLPGRVLILGGGTAGMNAARSAAGLGADVTVMETSQERMRELESQLPSQVHTIYSNEQHLDELLPETDLLVGAVLLPGASAPRLVTRSMVASMKRGAVVVDIAIDQGGCIETSRPTTHDEPVYIEEGVVHYCVTNMPGAYPGTSTEALTGVTLPYVRRLADLGLESAAVLMPGLVGGLNILNGKVVHPAVAASLGMECHENPFA